MGVGLRGESPHRVMVLGSESRITVNQIYNHFFPDNFFCQNSCYTEGMGIVWSESGILLSHL